MNRVIFTRSHDVAADSRLQKYVAVLKNSGVSARTIYWNRDGSTASDSNALAFRMRAKVGAGGGNLFKLLAFNLWLLLTLIRARKTYDCIHAVDLDTILPALAVSALLKKRLIYDIYDVYSASRNIGGWLGGRLDALERLCARRADYCILPSRVRAEQLQLALEDKLKILENVPMPTTPAEMDLKLDELGTYRVVFSYVGIFERTHRGLEDILRFFEDNPDYVLLIAGYGELASVIEEAANRLGNVIYFGSVSYGEAVTIMLNSDVILGFYYSSVPNHAYASPNKYYEHLMLAKPLYTSQHTPPGNLVEEYRTGKAVDDGYDALSEAFRSTDRVALSTFSANARALWASKFKNYHTGTFVPTYLAMLA